MLIKIIEEVKKCIENECFIAALTLALTIPDICGKAEYPELNTSERYPEWYNKYIGQYEKPWGNYKYSCDMPYSSGELVYSLRNHMLHQGTPDINSPKIEKEQGKVDNFSLIITDVYNRGFAGIRCDDNGEVKERTLEVNVVYLCNKISIAARKYYENNKDKFGFINRNIINVRQIYGGLFVEE